MSSPEGGDDRELLLERAGRASPGRDASGGPRPHAKQVSQITKNFCRKPPRKPPVVRPTTALSRAKPDGPLFPSPADDPPADTIIGRLSMSKRMPLLSAAAFAALALTATVVAPLHAEEKTVMVGGAAMFPSKNIVQNAVNSKDHTTLVAAVKAAGLVETLESKGPFTV
ncbi:hypothetical protein KXW55_008120, partial [Aspergillus fumigatus]